jgi:nucleoid-associated protein YgaU
MIFKGSRYEKLARSASTVTGSDGVQHRVLPLRLVLPTPAIVSHVMRASERLDLVAFQYYRNAEKFWLIADANPAMDPENLLVPGLPVLIPPDRSV